MKYLVVALLIGASFAVVLSNDLMDKIMDHVNECLKENNLTQADIMNIVEAKTAPEKVDENVKCAVKCVATKQGVMDEAGKLNADEVKKIMGNSPMFDAPIDKCKDQKGATPCDTAYLIFDCLVKEKP